MPDEVLATVREVIAYNDGAPRSQRVSTTALLAKLEDRFGWRVNEKTFNRTCRIQLGRKSFVQP